MFTFFSLFFVCMEISSFYTLWVDPSGENGKGIQLILFQSWRDMNEEEKSLSALLVAWVANVKIIFCSLLAVIAIFFKDHSLRATVSMIMCVTIPLYFVTMWPILHEMENKEMLEQGTSNYIDKSVIITETMWVVVCSWEIVCIYTA